MEYSHAMYPKDDYLNYNIDKIRNFNKQQSVRSTNKESYSGLRFPMASTFNRTDACSPINRKPQNSPSNVDTVKKSSKRLNTQLQFSGSEDERPLAAS